jgi:PQQ-dependent dehydrogenase (methanol/ethanol family)
MMRACLLCVLASACAREPSEGSAIGTQGAARLEARAYRRTPPLDPARSYAYVSNEDSGDVSVIDLSSEQLAFSVPVGKRPRGMRLSADRRTLYVAVSGSAKAPPGTDESGLPAPDRRADGIAVIDLASARVVRTLPSGPDPESFDLSADGRFLYVSNEDAAQTSVLDLATGEIVQQISVGGEPEGVTLCPAGTCVYVTSESEARVDVIDTIRNQVVARIATEARPRSIVFTRDGARAYVSNELGHSISEIDAVGHKLLRNLPVSLPGARPMGLALSESTGRLFVSLGRAGSVASLALKSGALDAPILDVGKRPWGMALATSTNSLYTANGPSNDVSVIDLETRAVRKRIAGGKSPWGVVVSEGRASESSAAPAREHAADELEQATRDDAQWVMPAKNYENTRFSGLSQIRADNVQNLATVWAFGTGISKGHEAAPLVIGARMYLVTPFPNRLIALDLGARAAKLAWVHDARPNRAAQGVACCDVVNRGAAYARGKLVYNTLDNHTLAVDAQTGRELWKTKLGDINRGESMTMAPLIVRDKVFVGNSGGEFGVRGWLTALSLETGEVAWRAYSTGPDSEVLIGAGFRPFYAMDRGTDLGIHSWPPGKWQQGGGTVWGFLSYDPLRDLIYYGTANPGPWNPEHREGDNKWTCGVFARKPDTGQAAWFYQWNPHDLYDHDGINENILVDLTLHGTPRALLLHADRNGYLYVLDRQSGEVLSATLFAHTTTTRGVDLESGRLEMVTGREVGTGKTVRNICPASPGAKDWQPAAFSKLTGLLYIPANNLCQDEQGYEANYIAGTPYLGAHNRMYAGPGGARGELIGWDVLAQKARFRVREEFPVWSGVVATQGGVIFYGTMDGWFKALDADNGRELWKKKLGSGVIGQPVTYLGPDGKQYVSVFAGVGGWSGAVVAGDLDRNDTTAALGFVGAMGDLTERVNKGGTLYTFALP